MEVPTPSRRQFLSAIGNLASATWVTLHWPQIALAAEHAGHGDAAAAPTVSVPRLGPAARRGRRQHFISTSWSGERRIGTSDGVANTWPRTMLGRESEPVATSAPPSRRRRVAACPRIGCTGGIPLALCRGQILGRTAPGADAANCVCDQGRYQIGEDQARSCRVSGRLVRAGSIPSAMASNSWWRGVGISSTRT